MFALKSSSISFISYRDASLHIEDLFIFYNCCVQDNLCIPQPTSKNYHITLSTKSTTGLERNHLVFLSLRWFELRHHGSQLTSGHPFIEKEYIRGLASTRVFLSIPAVVINFNNCTSKCYQDYAHTENITHYFRNNIRKQIFELSRQGRLSNRTHYSRNNINKAPLTPIMLSIVTKKTSSIK